MVRRRSTVRFRKGDLLLQVRDIYQNLSLVIPDLHVL